MSEFVQVRCKIPNGVVLRTFEEVEGPYETTSYFEKQRVTLNGGVNNVDPEFFAEWMKANSDNELVTNNFIKEI